MKKLFKILDTDSLFCALFGHKEGPENDSGFVICERCKSHSYYYSVPDDIYGEEIEPKFTVWENGGILQRPVFYVLSLYWKIRDAFYKYKHRNDLPF